MRADGDPAIEPTTESAPPLASLRLAVRERLEESLYLAALLCLTGEAGNFPARVTRGAGFILLSAFSISYLRRSPAEGKWFVTRLGALFAVSVAALLLPTPYVEVVPVLAVVGLLAWGNFRDGRVRARLKQSLVVGSAYVLVLKATILSPELGYAYRTVAQWLCQAAGAAIGRQLELGPTFLGLPVLLLLQLFVWFYLRGQLPVWRTALAASAAVAATVLFHGASEHLASVLLRRASASVTLSVFVLRQTALVPLGDFLRIYGPLVHLLFGVLLVTLCIPRFAFRNGATTGRRGVAPLLFLTLTFALACGSSLFFLPAGQPGDHIHFYEKGRFDWDLPKFGSYGGRSAGMFGLLPRFLRRLGYRATVGGLSPSTLAEPKVLVTINVRHRLNRSEIRAMHDFVRGGGSLLVLGDHTRFEESDPYNDLLAPLPVRFNFDTAQPLKAGWTDGLQLTPAVFPRPPTRAHRIQHWVGASLAISPPARPVILGRYCFSDYGNEENVAMNKLGDRRRNPSEQGGDLVLAAESKFGKGRVLVYGDTTSFQNRQLVQTWEYVANVFAYLAGPRRLSVPSIAALVLWLAAFAAFLVVRNRPVAAVLPLGILVSFLALAQLWVNSCYPERLPGTDRGTAPLAVVDISHGERLSLDSSKPEAVDGLAYNLMRNGFVPVIAERGLVGLARAARLVVLVAPAIPFATGAVDSLVEFVERGGVLFVTAGWEESAAVGSLLARFDITIGNEPLGRVVPVPEKGIVGLHEAWPVVCTAQDAVKLLYVFQKPVALYRPYGAGGVLVVGDTYFLQARNLEESGRTTPDGFRFRVSLANVRFLKYVFERFCSN